MPRHKLVLPALAAALLLAAIPASAQYYNDDSEDTAPSYEDDSPTGQDQSPEYDRPSEYDRPVPPRNGYGYRRPSYQPSYGNICVTARGNCQTPPLPYGTNCGCFIPGFGNKRGIVQ